MVWGSDYLTGACGLGGVIIWERSGWCLRGVNNWQGSTIWEECLPDWHLGFGRCFNLARVCDLGGVITRHDSVIL